MSDLFLHVVNLSITAGWIVLALLVLRLFLRKAPQWIRCSLWAIVGIRLIVPISIESVFSLLPSAQTIDTTSYASTPHIETGFSVLDNPINNYLGAQHYESVTVPQNHVFSITEILAVIWLIGIVVMLAYVLISYWRLKRKLRTATLMHDNIRQSEQVKSPFILGMIKPQIYLPYGIEESSMAYIIAHEQAHLKRRDHLTKLLAFLILSVYWFNPLIWIAYILLCRDIELACDEKVIKDMATEERRAYSKTLIQNSIKHRSIAACPLAFGEVGIKQRIKSVMNYKKPAFWIILVTVIVCVIFAVGFLTNPISKSFHSSENNLAIENHNWEFVLVQGNNGNILACSADEQEIYDTAKTVPLSVQAKDGKMELKNEDTGENWNIEYKINDKSIGGIIYDISCNGKTGFASTGVTEYYDGQSEYTMYLSINDYTIKFIESSSVSTVGGVDSSGVIVYTYYDSVDSLSPSITLSPKDKSFQFVYSGLSSLLSTGTYELTDTTLKLTETDIVPGRVYYFQVEQIDGEKAFVFNAERSSEIPEYKYDGADSEPVPAVPNGAVFRVTRA